MSELPCILDTEHALVLHWGFDPEVSLVDQDERVLTGAGSRRRGPDVGAAPGPLWVGQYRGPKPIVFGHQTLDQRFVGEYAINLGAHCFCGQHLFGILLPQRRIYVVKARRDYWATPKERALAVAVSCGDYIVPARRAQCRLGALEQLVREGPVSR
ncbi:MAG: hypothetical protein IMZ55_00970 [Acidobacteria bacterium]|nr:hypothetical protein [Planctomycetota bacterium]MBE3132018.1 hypothetical protein [Acidobacteriota bacterium]